MIKIGEDLKVKMESLSERRESHFSTDTGFPLATVEGEKMSDK